jgi:hypothetical protein
MAQDTFECGGELDVDWGEGDEQNQSHLETEPQRAIRLPTEAAQKSPLFHLRF